jgi:hypothetical protein
MIIHDDKPIYEIDFSQTEKNLKEYFLIHSALDNIDLLAKSKKDYFLGFIKVDEMPIFAYLNCLSIF